MSSSIVSFALLTALSAAALGACSSTSTVAPGNGAQTADGGSGAPISADTIGKGGCAGGTSPGDTAAFPDDGCAGGLCVADAREGVDDRIALTYCTASCAMSACPEGYTCARTTVGTDQVCLQDALPQQVANAAFDKKLPGYAASGTARAQIALRDFQNRAAPKGDLVLVSLVGIGAASAASTNLVTLVHDAGDAHLTPVTVLVLGASQVAPATDADLATWHGKASAVATQLDSSLANYSATFAKQVDAKHGVDLPISFLLDARTLEQLGGPFVAAWSSQQDLASALTEARAKL
ncbi:MAG: hypothetical protein JWP97_2782 [Labilithrix sp.]|nr:hypothetical protein [Labilithrix sp.]